jgi:hypothetical protein
MVLSALFVVPALADSTAFTDLGPGGSHDNGLGAMGAPGIEGISGQIGCVSILAVKGRKRPVSVH